MAEGQRLAGVRDYELVAIDRQSAEAYDYCAGGAASEATLATNTDAFRQFRLVPAAFPGEAPTLEHKALNASLDIPLGVSPVSMQEMTHEDAELGLARGAQAAGGFLILSCMASRTPEQVAAQSAGLLKLQQTYVFSEEALTASIVERAEDAGFGGIVVTADVPVQGLRYRDRRRALSRFKAHKPAICADPVFAGLATKTDEATVLAEQFPNPKASWTDVEKICARTNLPVLVKGIQSADDAQRSVAHGAAGVVVSNHGGRQLDHSIAAIDALAEVRDGLRDDAIVWFDSGIRSGTDAFVALALGASAVTVGRPAIWGLAAGGANGVAAVLAALAEELHHAMWMTGASSINDISMASLRSTAWRR